MIERERRIMSLGRRDETVISKLDAVCTRARLCLRVVRVQLYITVYNVTFHSHVRRSRRRRHRKAMAHAGVAGVFVFRGSLLSLFFVFYLRMVKIRLFRFHHHRLYFCDRFKLPFFPKCTNNYFLA